jgi:hypothetical protein
LTKLSEMDLITTLYGIYSQCQKSKRQSKRGLASSDEEAKERVARAGGEAPHDERGLQAVDEKTKERVAREGGKS